MIKSANAHFVNTFQSEYDEANPKNTELVLRLARVLIEGKRWQKDELKAIKILTASILVEAKFMLMNIAFNHGIFSDVYHYFEYYLPHKCTWVMQAKKSGTRADDYLKPNHAIVMLENRPPLCYKHISKFQSYWRIF